MRIATWNVNSLKARMEALDVDTDFEDLRWFWLPDEIAAR